MSCLDEVTLPGVENSLMGAAANPTENLENSFHAGEPLLRLGPTRSLSILESIRTATRSNTYGAQRLDRIIDSLKVIRDGEQKQNPTFLNALGPIVTPAYKSPMRFLYIGL